LFLFRAVEIGMDVVTRHWWNCAILQNFCWSSA